MKTIINNQNKNILGRKSSINTSTCNCQSKETCPLSGQCQIGENLSSNQPKDAYTTTIYLPKMNFIKTAQNFLRNSGKSRWRITPRKLLGGSSENAYHIIIKPENVIYV